MSVPQEEGAWLEAANGRRYPIKGNCSLGRSGANTIVLESPKVSRRHALIHLQNIGELWLIDFGSSNGNFFQQAANSSPDSTQRWRSNHNWRSGFQGSAAGRNFRSIQNGGHATDVPGDRRYPSVGFLSQTFEGLHLSAGKCKARIWTSSSERGFLIAKK